MMSVDSFAEKHEVMDTARRETTADHAEQVLAEALCARISAIDEQRWVLAVVGDCEKQRIGSSRRGRRVDEALNQQLNRS